MDQEIIITPEEFVNQKDGALLIDLRMSLTDPLYGRAQYAISHIEGAVRMEFDEVFAGPRSDTSGRHPWPEMAGFRQMLAQKGVGSESRIVFYDDGAMNVAGRAALCARWAGVRNARVLEGGMKLWKFLGLPQESVRRTLPQAFELEAAFPEGLPNEAFLRVLGKEAFVEAWRSGDYLVVDSRPADRYRGENETLDVRAGHVPGAVSRPASENFTPDGRLKSRKDLFDEWNELLGGRDPEKVIQMCGSGGAASSSVLALDRAGLLPARSALIYPGSWSEWARDASLPLETGCCGQ